MQQLKLKAGFQFLVISGLIAFWGSNFLSCTISKEKSGKLPWEEHGQLKVVKGDNIIRYEDGTPFLWIGGTPWGMVEWLSREDVDYYLDDRKEKGFNVVQICVLWGKYPGHFSVASPENYYGHKALLETDSVADPLKPAIVEGGSPENPNDFWDHVDYCIKAMQKRGMYAAILPTWGRRYINATHHFPCQILNKQNISKYGEFLGERYGNEPNIIWVEGGDVKASDGGDYTMEYRLLAEGIAKGATGKDLKWNEPDPAWDQVLLTYHPDGAPMLNSSAWFQEDIWLDFNMIETFTFRDRVVKAIRQDLEKSPLKPTVLGEPHYEGITAGKKAEAIHVRRQAWQSFFAGAAGFTYGGGFDDDGNGPLFSPANNWKGLLSWPGSGQMLYLRHFLEDHNWGDWQILSDFIESGKGEGELEKLAVQSGSMKMIYFPDKSGCVIKNSGATKYSWYRPSDGTVLEGGEIKERTFELPSEWEDGVLILE